MRRWMSEPLGESVVLSLGGIIGELISGPIGGSIRELIGEP